MPKYVVKQCKNKSDNSTDTLLETWIKNDSRSLVAFEDRRETQLELDRAERIHDKLEYLRGDEYLGDINKFIISPPNQDSDNDLYKPYELNENKDENINRPKIEEVGCGEPFREQHFYIDFTPIPGVDDNEELIQKNEDFWNFFSNDKEMQKIMKAKPQRPPPPRLDLPSVSTTRSSSVLSSNDILAGAYWLDKDEIDLTAATISRPKYCDDDNKEYFSEDDIVKKRLDDFDKIKNTLMIKKLPQLPQRKSYEHGCARQSELDKIKLNKIKKDMNEFDLKNPKSFDPPGKLPELITAKLQRHPFRGVIPDSNNELFKQ